MEEGVHFTGRLSFPLDDDLGGGVTARLEGKRGSDRVNKIGSPPDISTSTLARADKVSPRFA